MKKVTVKALVPIWIPELQKQIQPGETVEIERESALIDYCVAQNYYTVIETPAVSPGKIGKGD